MLLRNVGMPSGTAVGPSGKNYDVRNGFIDVTEPEDVEPLRALGFELPDDGRPTTPVAPATAPAPAPRPALDDEFPAAGGGVLEVVDDAVDGFGFGLKGAEPPDDDVLGDDAFTSVEGDEPGRCQGTTKRGARCRLPVIGDSAYCHVHQDQAEEE